MFPLTMSEHRERVFAALARLVWSMDAPAAVSAYLGQLGVEHRKFGVKAKHYTAFFDALLATVQHFSGPAWTERTRQAVTMAAEHTAAAMLRAADLDAQRQPAWWVGEIVRHELRSANLAVLRIRPDQPLRYRAGQYLSVQVARWPRVWRNYSIANAARPDGTLDLHIRAIPGGQVSRALVHDTRAGDTVLLGPARGTMVVDHGSARDILCIAGGTGFAPIKAIIEGLAVQQGSGATRRVRLFAGARRRRDLYDLADLARLESQCPRLEVITALSDDPGAQGRHGLLHDVVRQQAGWQDCDVFLSGPPGMVRATLRVLAHRASDEHLHCDPHEDAEAWLPA